MKAYITKDGKRLNKRPCSIKRAVMIAHRREAKGETGILIEVVA